MYFWIPLRPGHLQNPPKPRQVRAAGPALERLTGPDWLAPANNSVSSHLLSTTGSLIIYLGLAYYDCVRGVVDPGSFWGRHMFQCQTCLEWRMSG